MTHWRQISKSSKLSTRIPSSRPRAGTVLSPRAAVHKTGVADNPLLLPHLSAPSLLEVPFAVAHTIFSPLAL